MLVVPDPAQLVVEASVDNTDVGFIHPGQRAEVKADAFGVTAETYNALPVLSSNGGNQAARTSAKKSLTSLVICSAALRDRSQHQTPALLRRLCHWPPG